MMAALEDLKRRYNKTLERQKAAEVYFERKDVSIATFEKWMYGYNEIVKELSYMMMEYEKLTGNQMDDSNVLEGF